MTPAEGKAFFTAKYREISRARLDRPETARRLAALRGEMTALQARATPERAEREALQKEIAAKRARVAELTAAIRASDGQRAREIPLEMRALTTAIGDPVICHQNPGRRKG